MPRPTKEEADAKAYDAYVQAHAVASIGAALHRAGIETSHQGGLVVAVADPDGVPMRYYLRLTPALATGGLYGIDKTMRDV